jgi:N6-L-threonylcarbamoyladenine synthase
MPSIIFAIESSCDETSAAILNDNIVLSNVISSQLFHSKYGGIVPELASRAHIESIDRIANEALKSADVDSKKIDVVAATKGPGLIGSLLVGLNYAKAFSLAKKTKFIGVNHIESHLYSCFIGNEHVDFPFIALVVSGGHTLLILVKNYFEYLLLGQTQDDAAGEAFDKVAKLLGLGYPGGPLIDKHAREGNEDFHKFPVGNVKENIYDFSFSGIKTSVLYFLKNNYGEFRNSAFESKVPISDVCASFQKAVVKSLLQKTLLAANNFKIKRIAVSGGVSANSRLRKEFYDLSTKGYEVYFPSAEYSTDNAAMIGYTAYLKSRFSQTSEKDYKSFLFEPAFAKFDYLNL